MPVKNIEKQESAKNKKSIYLLTFTLIFKF